MKYFQLSIFGLIISIIGFVSLPHVQAKTAVVCGNEHSNGCVTPTPTRTPTPTLTPTPTVVHCAQDKHHRDEDQHCGETPTPTISVSPTAGESATPTMTPTVTASSNGTGWSPKPEGQNSTTNAPGTPSCTIPFAAPLLVSGSRVNATTIVYHWWLSTDPNIEFQAIVFGYKANDLSMGALPIDKHVTSLDITQLHAKQPVYAQVWSFKGGCASRSNTLEVK